MSVVGLDGGSIRSSGGREVEERARASPNPEPVATSLDHESKAPA